MKKTSRSRLKALGLLIFAGLMVYFLFFRAPSEARMLNKFHQHKAEFEEIRLMLAQDKCIATIGPDWVQAKYAPSKNSINWHEMPLTVSAGRIEPYRSRLRELGLSRVDCSLDGSIHLAQLGGGFTDTTWSIGYYWSAKPPRPLVNSAYAQRPPRDKWDFSRIEGNWYLYQRR
jgi:hypothetical protein